MTELRIATSAFTAAGWEGSFYLAGISTFVYANNHYAGHAPVTVEQFLKLWNGNSAGT
jgi:uncharacterized protein YecE (DUF72 family)